MASYFINAELLITFSLKAFSMSNLFGTLHKTRQRSPFCIRHLLQLRSLVLNSTGVICYISVNHMFVAYRFEVDMVEGLHKQRALETRLLKHLLESDIILPLLVGKIQHRDFLGHASRGFIFFPFCLCVYMYNFSV